MELAGVPTDDRNAGYIDEAESDLEYSDFEDGDWDVDRYSYAQCVILFNAHRTFYYSSDEEEQWKYLHEKLSGISGNEEEDDFDKCMDDELTQALDAYIKGFNEDNSGVASDAVSTINSQENKETKKTSNSSPHTQNPESSNKAATNNKDSKDEYYDDLYFSSGSSEDMSDSAGPDHEQKKKQNKNKRRKLTNDELLYDPEMDKEDERWVNRQRMAYRNGIQVISNLISIVILLE